MFSLLPSGWPSASCEVTRLQGISLTRWRGVRAPSLTATSRDTGASVWFMLPGHVVLEL